MNMDVEQKYCQSCHLIIMQSDFRKDTILGYLSSLIYGVIKND
jgi:hypothetical protein